MPTKGVDGNAEATKPASAGTGTEQILRKDAAKEAPKTDAQLLASLQTFRKTLSDRYIGREEEAKVITLGLVAGLHVIFVGEPGTAKTDIIRDAADLVEAKYFYYQMHKNTKDHEVFGPLDVIAMKNNEYKTITKGKLPEAEIVYLDEIFNANSSSLNQFLQAMQERIVYDAYSGPKAIPLHMLISSTNQIPEETDLAAIFDRFVIRHRVQAVDRNSWEDLIKKTWKGKRSAVKKPRLTPQMSMDDFKALGEMLKPMPDAVISEYTSILAKLEDSSMNIRLSDRSKILAHVVISAHALINGRFEPEVKDLIALKYVAPRTVEEFEKVAALLAVELRLAEPYIEHLEELRKDLEQKKQMWADAGNASKKLPEGLYKKYDALKAHIIEDTRASEIDSVKKAGLKLIKDIEDFQNGGK